ncbi:MAG: peptidoglycan editing factor PgeF [Mediterranea massiliensis]|nr:peptidoglycan editing factor PgeF [Mediterranea massiliensis]
MIYYPIKGVTSFSTTREGGYSKGNYASMNCTPYTGDNMQAVQRNQQLLCAALPHPSPKLIIPYQTHGTKCCHIDQTFLSMTDNEQHQALQGIDAVISKEINVCLCVSTADCIPILLYDQQEKVIATIHAGWRGSVGKIVTICFEEMQRLYSCKGENIQAVIGPGISLDAFEVGDEVYEAFQNNGFPMEYISQWHPETHKWHIDLPAANYLQLLDLEVPEKQIYHSNICTFTRYQEFFSARRMGIHSGRILTGIMINS